MDQERFRSGNLSTSYIKDEFPDGFNGAAPDRRRTDILIATAAAMNEILAEQSGDPSDRTDWIVLIDRDAHGVTLGYDDDEALTLDLAGEDRALQLSDIDWRPGLAQFRAVLDDEPFTAEVARVADGFSIRTAPPAPASASSPPRIGRALRPPAREDGRRHLQTDPVPHARPGRLHRRRPSARRSRPAKPSPSSKP